MALHCREAAGVDAVYGYSSVSRVSEPSSDREFQSEIAKRDQTPSHSRHGRNVGKDDAPLVTWHLRESIYV